MRRLLSTVALLTCGLAGGETMHVDVSAWGDVGTGVTAEGWTVTNIMAYAEGGIYFNAFSGLAVSPVYPGLVTQVVANARSSASAMTRHLTLMPRLAKQGAHTNVAETTASGKYEKQRFVWRYDEGVRQFSFQMIGSGSGNWGLKEVMVYLDRVERPENLRTGSRYLDAFEAHWDAEPRAVRFEIAAGRVDEVLPAFTSLKEWNFSVLTNVSGNTKSFLELDPPEELQDVGGESLCLQANAGGHLQIGKDNVAGTMELPLPEGVDRTALMTLFRHEKDDADGIVSNLVVTASGVTNVLPNVWLTVRPTEFRLDIPNDAMNLVLCSLKARRVRVTDVRIVTDYVPGSVTTNWTASCFARGKECVVKGLSSGLWLWRVRAYDANDWDSPWSAFGEALLDNRSRRYAERGLGLILR